MAIVDCPECGKNVSTKATTCPNCGCPLDFGPGKSFSSFSEEDWQKFEKALESENKHSRKLKVFAVLGTIILTPIQWILIFLTGISGGISHILSGLFLIGGFLIWISDGNLNLAWQIFAISFALFVLPVIAEKIVQLVSGFNYQLRDYIKS